MKEDCYVDEKDKVSDAFILGTVQYLLNEEANKIEE